MSDQMRPHPHGLEGRVADALDDLALLKAAGVPPIECRSAQLLADAPVDALRADTSE